jgi:hypothetical protein
MRSQVPVRHFGARMKGWNSREIESRWRGKFKPILPKPPTPYVSTAHSGFGQRESSINSVNPCRVDGRQINKVKWCGGE